VLVLLPQIARTVLTARIERASDSINAYGTIIVFPYFFLGLIFHGVRREELSPRTSRPLYAARTQASNSGKARGDLRNPALRRGSYCRGVRFKARSGDEAFLVSPPHLRSIDRHMLVKH
jgi:hypothetical protein